MAVGPDGRQPLWMRFDSDWYVRRYPASVEQMSWLDITDVHDYYRHYGSIEGHSPNALFDENWYLEAYVDVRKGVLRKDLASGFEEYCTTGFMDRDAHWLFSDRVYREHIGGLTAYDLERSGYRNSYDHYLSEPETDGVSGSVFFDPVLCRDIARLHPDHFPAGQGLYESYLKLPREIADVVRVSRYFDPVWYLDSYPDVVAAIAAGRYDSALHHYLTNDTPRRYSPMSWFSEAHYDRAHPDVLASIDGGHFRNGYDHFLRFGVFEGRSPHADIDLRAYTRRADVLADTAQGLYRDPFVRYLQDMERTGQHPHALSAIDEAHAKQVYLRRTEVMLPVILRRGLDFSCTDVPRISVIVVLFNQFALTMTTLASLRANFTGAIDLVLVDSGSTDATRSIETYVKGAQILRFRHNIGYLDGCNAALAQVRAPAVLYMNNDITLMTGAVSGALARLESEARIGAVGAKIVRTNGALQEAGSIIWRDGTTYGYLRNDDPNDPQANFVRDVDFCSAAFLLIRTEVARQINGFDTLFRPSYFEDTDLCIRIIEAGYRIVYDPTVMIEHLEFGSSDREASLQTMLVNHRKFVHRHVDFLRYQQPSHHLNKVAARGRKGDRRRVLFIDDYVPLPQQGSGYVRSNAIVSALAGLGYEVTVFPVIIRHIESLKLFENFPETVEIIADRGLADLSDFLAERAGYYDAVWVGRTHNLARMLPILGEANRYLPSRGMILDTEVVATPRAFERARILGKALPEQNFDQALQDEFSSAYHAQHIVAVTQSDAALIRRAGHHDVSVLGHAMLAEPTPAAWSERRGLLFIGAVHEADSPNYDSLVWFVEEILPRLDVLLPPDVRVTVAGYVRPGVDMGRIGRHRRVDLVGAVRDLQPLYDAHRVFVAPTRFAGGLPYKLHEAASHGVPIVATALLAAQLGWQDGEDLLGVPDLDADAFARAIARVYDDEALWARMRSNALARIERDCHPVAFVETLDAILHQAMT